MNWRGLYITALGSETADNKGDESAGREFEDPFGSLPELPDAQGETWATAQSDPQIGANGEEPVRYLILTKYNPHRRQLGRVVDRINSMGTTRIFALRNLSLIREASQAIRLRGEQLDSIIDFWIDKRGEIKDGYGDEEQKDRRNELLAELNAEIENELLEIGSALNKIGSGSVGGLAYRISRAKLYAQRFDDLRKDLLIGSIESWTSYNQFALRNIQPLFSFIDQTGERLVRLRQRLASTMENIQTAALVSQTEETRQNTRELEKLQASATNLGWIGAAGFIIASVQPIESIVNKWFDKCVKPGSITPHITCRAYDQLFGREADGKIDAFWSLFIAITVILVGIAIALSFKRLGLIRLMGKVSLAFAVLAAVGWWVIYSVAVSGAVAEILAKLLQPALTLSGFSLLGWLIGDIARSFRKTFHKKTDRWLNSLLKPLGRLSLLLALAGAIPRSLVDNSLISGPAADGITENWILLLRFSAAFLTFWLVGQLLAGGQKLVTWVFRESEPQTD